MDRVFFLVEGVIRTKEVTEDIARESFVLLQLFIFHDGTDLASAETYLGGDVDLVYKRLHDLYDFIDSGFNRSDFDLHLDHSMRIYRSQVLHLTAMGLFLFEHKFAEEKGLAPLDTRYNYVVVRNSERALYLAFALRFMSLRGSTQCSNLSCSGAYINAR